jgi:hypothetical protein
MQIVMFVHCILISKLSVKTPLETDRRANRSEFHSRVLCNFDITARGISKNMKRFKTFINFSLSRPKIKKKTLEIISDRMPYRRETGIRIIINI